jgi:hypothetical protein
MRIEMSEENWKRLNGLGLRKETYASPESWRQRPKLGLIDLRVLPFRKWLTTNANRIKNERDVKK